MQPLSCTCFMLSFSAFSFLSLRASSAFLLPHPLHSFTMTWHFNISHAPPSLACVPPPPSIFFPPSHPLHYAYHKLALNTFLALLHPLLALLHRFLLLVHRFLALLHPFLVLRQILCQHVYVSIFVCLHATSQFMLSFSAFSSLCLRASSSLIRCISFTMTWRFTHFSCSSILSLCAFSQHFF